MNLETLRKQDVRKRCEEALMKAKEYQSVLNAVVTFYDIEEQLQNLEHVASDAPLYGVPVVLKDNINTKGVRTTASSVMLDQYVPVYDAHVVEKLKQAGAIIIAKASMDELGMGGTNLNAHTGKVNNPWDVQRISGGSSGGSAVLVASDVVALAIGTDTGDSIRKPAAFNGVVGIKPTYGRISRYGVIPYASSLDHVGYLTAQVKDAALALEVLAGRDDRDATSSHEAVGKYASNINSDMKGKKIAILGNVMDEIQNEQVKQNFDELMKKLEARGAIVERVHFDDQLMHLLLSVYYIIANAEATANHSNLDGIRFGLREDGDTLEEIMMNSRTKGFSSNVRKRFIIGSYALYTENQDKIYKKAQKVRRLIVEELKCALETYDAVIACAAPDVAPTQKECMNGKLKKIQQVADNHMVLGNFSGYPSMTVPTGYIDGLPIGVNITTKPFDEQTLFDIGVAIEEETGIQNQCAEVKV